MAKMCMCVCVFQSKRGRENIQSYGTNANRVGFHLSLQHPLWKIFAFPQSQLFPTCPSSKPGATEQGKTLQDLGHLSGHGERRTQTPGKGSS